MRKLILRWLGVCEHPSWETLGNVMTGLDGGAMLVERCSVCRLTNLYKI